MVVMRVAGLSRWIDSVRWVLVFTLVGLVLQPQAAVAASKVITDADKGGEVRLKAGERFELRLKSNPSTGYMWYVEGKSTPLVKLVKQTQTEAEEPGAGRPVFQVFTFEAKRPGEGILMLHYVRSWEKPAAEDEHFDVHLRIE
jgi:inhibitor of cysteine peptidase